MIVVISFDAAAKYILVDDKWRRGRSLAYWNDTRKVFDKASKTIVNIVPIVYVF